MLWAVIVSVIVLLAIYVSVGRMLASLTASHQQLILQELNQHLPFRVEARRVSAEWHSFTPTLVLEELRLTLPSAPGHPLQLAGGRVGLDVAGSLRSQTLKSSRLRLEGLSLAGRLDGSGQIHIQGFEGGGTGLAEWAEEFLRTVDEVALDDLRLNLGLPTGEQREFELDLALLRDGSRRWLEAQLASSRGLRVHAAGEGVGNPFAPEAFSGQLYLDVKAAEVGALLELAGERMPPLRLGGGVDLQTWFTWERGEPAIEARVGLDQPLLGAADDSWTVSLDRLSFVASARQRQQRWDLSLADLVLARGDVQLQVARAQLEARGSTLQLRAAGLPLGPLGALAAHTQSLPEAARELLLTLAPEGGLSSLQLDIPDIGSPLQEWKLSAALDGVAVRPWHGAPGVTGASGFVELAPGGGRVILDSRRFSMDFPTVYRQPLVYDDFHGTFNVAWNDQEVRLSSGLVQAAGAEGPVRVLFALSIPLADSEVGLEMDLLVGLQGSRPVHRGKYLPYTLAPGLLGWLKDSIGTGRIAQGGFLWRGALVAPSPLLHTVQLFFNIEDTALEYHSDWPALTAVEGIVFIDDSRVSVWAPSARLLDSQVKDLGVEVWQDAGDQLMLDARAHISGPAADGLAAINDSPLGPASGGVFAQWSVSGDLATDLSLRLNLSDQRAAPQVDLRARLDDVDLDIVPGELPLRGVGGELAYSSNSGFSADALAGRLWGQTLRATVTQQAPGEAAGGHPATRIDIASRVAMEPLREWLGQDWLAFAQGSAAVEARLAVIPGAPLALSLSSSLEGVSLDLPPPFDKAADSRRALLLELSLAGEHSELGVELEGGVAAGLSLGAAVPADGVARVSDDETATSQLRAAGLAFGGEAVALEPGRFVVAGALERADLDLWQDFYAAYLRPPEGEQGAPQAQPLALQVSGLQVQQLLWRGSDLGPVRLQLAEPEGRLRAAVQADWVRAQWSSPAQGLSLLEVGFLDLDRLGELQLTPGDGSQTLELPSMAVRLDGLQRGGEDLGKLAFELRSGGGILQADAISGEIAGLRLPADQPGQLRWQQGEGGRSSLAASLYFDNLGDTLQRFGYQNMIETEDGHFDLALEWPGAPQDFTLAAASGSVGVAIGEGHFPEVSAAASGTLRVVSIVNLAEIVQQLSLAHMFESGIPFNAIAGQVDLQGGAITVQDMDVQGSASRFQFTGVSDVASESLDGELIVTLPVANNLPWVAALTAGLPVAAGVFVLSKLFESQVNRLTSLVYTATGTWDEPVVKFDRVFDDSAVKANAGSPQPERP